MSLLLEVRASAAVTEPISNQRTEVAQLTEQNGPLEARIDNLSERYDGVEREAHRLSDRVALVRSKLTTDAAHMKSVRGRLRGEALNIFTHRVGARRDLATEDVLHGHLVSLHVAEPALSTKQAKLHHAQRATRASLARTASSLQALEQASSEDRSLLNSLNAQLAQLVADQDQAGAPAPADPAPAPTATTTTTASPSTPATAAGDASADSDNGYANPLRAVSGLTPERIDQGVDYGGVGSLYALGPGVITCDYHSGWPNGVFIVEELTAGPDAGQYWYSAEYIDPAVSVGEPVNSSTVIGTLTGAAGGIELG